MLNVINILGLMFGGFNTPLFLNLDASKKNCYIINVNKKKTNRKKPNSKRHARKGKTKVNK